MKKQKFLYPSATTAIVTVLLGFTLGFHIPQEKPAEVQAENEACTMISFIQPLNGVDGNTSAWSDDSSTVNLGVDSWSLLGGSATVTGYTNSQSHSLTHRGTRGLGVHGQETDEIDSHDQPEKMIVTFNDPVNVDEFEVRSLFSNEPNSPEEGNVDLYLGNSLVDSYHLVATDSGTNGVFNKEISSQLVDRIEFYIPENQSYTSFSEYAVAKINVCTAQNSVCGNGVLEEGEQCDDGNNVSGDGCSSTCIDECPVGDAVIDTDVFCWAVNAVDFVIDNNLFSVLNSEDLRDAVKHYRFYQLVMSELQ